MMRKGTNPKGASPASRRSERTSAGRTDETRARAPTSPPAIWERRKVRRTLRVRGFQSRAGYSTIFFDPDFNFIPHRSSGFSRSATRQFQNRRRLGPDRGKTPGLQVTLDVDYRHRLIQINHVDGKSHA